MKSQVLIGLSALALLVLLAVQYIFIKETYTTKLRLIDSRYEQLAKEALSEFNHREISDAFDSVLFLMDNLALDFIFAPSDTVSPWDSFREILTAYDEREAFLRDGKAYLYVDGKRSDVWKGFTWRVEGDRLIVDKPDGSAEEHRLDDQGRLVLPAGLGTAKRVPQ